MGDGWKTMNFILFTKFFIWLLYEDIVFLNIYLHVFQETCAHNEVGKSQNITNRYSKRWKRNDWDKVRYNYTEQIETCRWKNNACCPVRILEWAQLASHVTPTTYPELISLIISRAFFPYFSKGIGCRLITLEIWLRILSADPPWLIIRLKRAIADGKKSEKRRVQRDIRRNSDMIDP